MYNTMCTYIAVHVCMYNTMCTYIVCVCIICVCVCVLCDIVTCNIISVSVEGSKRYVGSPHIPDSNDIVKQLGTAADIDQYTQIK